MGDLHGYALWADKAGRSKVRLWYFWVFKSSSIRLKSEFCISERGCHVLCLGFQTEHVWCLRDRSTCNQILVIYWLPGPFVNLICSEIMIVCDCGEGPQNVFQSASQPLSRAMLRVEELRNIAAAGGNARARSSVSLYDTFDKPSMTELHVQSHRQKQPMWPPTHHFYHRPSET